MSASAFVTRDDGSVAVYQSAGDRLDYGLDHAGLLLGGDTIASSVWTASGGVAVVDTGVAGSVVVATIEGTSGVVYNTVSTQAGRRRVTTFCVELPAHCA